MREREKKEGKKIGKLIKMTNIKQTKKKFLIANDFFFSG